MLHRGDNGKYTTGGRNAETDGVGIRLLAGPAPAEEAMTGDELEALLGDDKTIGPGGPGAGYEWILPSSETTGSAKTDKGEVIQIDGVWYIERNQLCRTWKAARTAKIRCASLWMARKSVSTTGNFEGGAGILCARLVSIQACDTRQRPPKGPALIIVIFQLVGCFLVALRGRLSN
jgi:hypothetical protein